MDFETSIEELCSILMDRPPTYIVHHLEKLMNSFGLPLTKGYYLEDENDYKKKANFVEKLKLLEVYTEGT